MRVFYLAALLLFLAASPTASLAEKNAPSLNPRAEKLLRDIEARRSLPISDKRWKYKNGPWAEYLDRYLKEKANSEHRALFWKAWKDNDCSRMVSLVHKDFVQRFPDLAPAHAKDYVRDYFKWTFIYELPLLLYCHANVELKLALDFSEHHEFRIFPFYALWAANRRSSKIAGRRVEDTPQNRARNTLCSAFEKLTRAALLDRNIPAIGDLIRHARMAKLVVLTPEQEYVLIKIARDLGLYDSNVDELDVSLRAGMDLKKLEEIDRFFAEEKLGLPPIGIFGVYWRCPEPFIDPLLKMP